MIQKKDSYINEDIYLKEKYVPYSTTKDIVGGKEVTIEYPYSDKISIRYYNLIPGITIIETNSNIETYYTDHENILEYRNPENIIIINSIIKGRCQIPYEKDKYIFLKEGSMNIYSKKDFPSSFHYLGESHVLHIVLNKKFYKPYPIDKNKKIIETIEHVFNITEKHSNIIYNDNDNIKQIINQIVSFETEDGITKNTYQTIKVFEFIVYIANTKIEMPKFKQHAYTDPQIRVVRKIKNVISRDIAGYDSIEGLSIEYGINITVLKNCFKDMYGKPLYSWYRTYKFHRAKDLIKNTNYPISKIANMIGYKSSSKFTKAFKNEIGELPSSYRKKNKE